jgi:hypothetical protein
MYRRRRVSFAEIERELEKLTPEQLRSLALKSWSAFVQNENRAEAEMNATKMIRNSCPLSMRPLKKRTRAQTVAKRGMRFGRS